MRIGPGIALFLAVISFTLTASAQDDIIGQQIANLRDSDPLIRETAAFDLGRFNDLRAVEPLISALGDPTGGVRAGAAFALGKLQDRRATKALIGLLQDKDDLVQFMLATALGELKDPSAIPPLIEIMKHPSPGGTRLAGLMLSEIGSPAIAALIELLKDPDPAIRVQAVQALGGIKDPRNVDALIAALRDKSASVRAAAVPSLSASEDPRVVDLMLAAFRDTDANVRRAALAGLEHSNDPRVVEVFKAGLKDPADQVRMYAAIDLGYAKSDWAVTLLIEGLKTGDAVVRQWSADALGGTGNPRAVEPLIGALQDKSGVVRFAVCQALGKLKDPRAVAPLTAILLASRFNGDATDALGNIGDARAVQPLIQAMVNPENQSKEAYARALGKLGAPAAEPLLTLLKRKDSYTEGPAIGRAALSALAQTGDRRAVPFLIKALEDRDIAVAGEAWSALGQLKDPRAIAPLIESLKLEPGESQGGVFRSYSIAQFGSAAVEPLLALMHDPNPRTRYRAAETLFQIADPRSAQALLGALRDKDYAAIAGGFEFYVDLGVPGSEDALVQAFKINGDQHKAMNLVGCGNPKIEAAARAWFKRNQMDWRPGPTNPFWGARAVASSKATQ